MVSSLQEINKLKSRVADINVPLDVFDYIDKDKNPNLFTKDCMDQAAAKNDEVRDKINGIRRLKALLIREMYANFPNELYLNYTTIRPDF